LLSESAATSQTRGFDRNDFENEHTKNNGGVIGS
jgi:hypothetical protein